MKNRNSALVVLSGGQDSSTCLFWAKTQFEHVEALSFRYGQKHVVEIEYAKRIAQKAGVLIHVLDIPFVETLTKNCSLIQTDIPMDKEKPANALPNTFVPGRNMFFLTIAAIFARERNIFDLVTGVSQTDFSGYPDCHDSFIRSLNVTINLATDDQFVIHTPLMWLSKAETWQLADQLGVFDLIKDETLTCYNGIAGQGCGECPACQLRQQGLEEYLNSKNK